MLRRRIDLVVTLGASALILAFVVPLCLLVATLAQDRALAAARQEATAAATLVATVADRAGPSAIMRVGVRHRVMRIPAGHHRCTGALEEGEKFCMLAGEAHAGAREDDRAPHGVSLRSVEVEAPCIGPRDGRLEHQRLDPRTGCTSSPGAASQRRSGLRRWTGSRLVERP